MSMFGICQISRLTIRCLPILSAVFSLHIMVFILIIYRLFMFIVSSTLCKLVCDVGMNYSFYGSLSDV